MNQSLVVFLSHYSGDKPMVRLLARLLERDGFRPWLDEENLRPGQRWQDRISTAVKSADVVLICFSSRTAATETYVQQEISLVLEQVKARKGEWKWRALAFLSGIVDEDTLRGMRERDESFLIPVLLENCSLPERLNGWHAVRLFENGGYETLLEALRRYCEIKASIAGSVSRTAEPAASKPNTPRPAGTPPPEMELLRRLGHRFPDGATHSSVCASCGQSWDHALYFRSPCLAPR